MLLNQDHKQTKADTGMKTRASFGAPQVYPMATAVPVESIAHQVMPSAPPPHIPPALIVVPSPVSGMLPTLQNEAGAREFLTARRWPEGLQNTFVANVSRTPLRYFICDDSGSMQTNDGNFVAQAGATSK